MKTASSLLAVVVLATASAVGAAAPSDRATTRQPVASNPSGATTAVAWQGPGVRGARAAAAKGPNALRLYVQRTRMIYGLRYEDYLQP